MKHPAAVLAAALLFLSAILITYRILWLGYPAFPAASGKAWQISMDAYVKAAKKEATVKIGLPFSFGERIVVEERIHSGTLNFNLLRQGPNQVGVWSGAPGAGEEVIHYSATILIRPKRSGKVKPPEKEPFPANIGKEEQFLVQRLTKRWIELPPSHRFRAIVAMVKREWEVPAPDAHDLEAWTEMEKKYGRPMALQILLRAKLSISC